MQVKSNYPKLNSTQNYLVSRALDRTMRGFYKNKENQKAFEEWKKKKETSNG